MEITQEELDKLVAEAVLAAFKGEGRYVVERVFRKAGVGDESKERAEQIMTLAASVRQDVGQLPALITSVYGLRKSVANQLVDEATRMIREDQDTSMILIELRHRFPKPKASRVAVLVLNHAIRPVVRTPSRKLQVIGAVVLALGLGVWSVSAVMEQPLGLIGVPVSFVGAVVLYKGIRG